MRELFSGEKGREEVIFFVDKNYECLYFFLLRIFCIFNSF